MQRLRKKWLAVLLAGAIPLLSGATGEACSSLVVGREASATGHAFFGRSVDIDTQAYKALGVYLKVFPAGMFRQGEVFDDPYLRRSYGEEAVFRYTFSHDSYRFLASPFTPQLMRLKSTDPLVYESAGVNEKGVAVSATNTTWLRKAAEADGNAYALGGLSESSMVLVVLAEADTARDGVLRLGQVVETAGVGEEDGGVILIGDSREVWVFETAGRHRWVASRLPDDKFLVVANDMVTDYVDLTDTENYLGSADIQQFAIDHGFAVYGPKGSSHEHEVNIAASYGDINSDAYDTHRRWRGYSRFAPSAGFRMLTGQQDTYPMFVKPDQKISPLDEMHFHRDRYEGLPYDLSVSRQPARRADGWEFPENGESLGLAYWTWPFGFPGAVTTHILELNGYPPEIGARVWYCLSEPGSSVYVPYYGNVTDTHPDCQTFIDGHYRVEDGHLRTHPQYQADSASLVFEELGLYARSNRALYGNVIKAYWEGYERQLMAEQPAVEQELLSLYAQDPAASARFATAYSMQAEQRVLNRASLITQKLREHIARQPKERFTVPTEDTPYVALALLPDSREDVNAPLVVTRAFVLPEGASRPADAATQAELFPVAPEAGHVLSGPALLQRARLQQGMLADSTACLQAKLMGGADFARVRYTVELLGADYARFGNDVDRVRREFVLRSAGGELIGPQGTVSLAEAMQAGAVRVIGDANRATVTVELYVCDLADSPAWQSGLLLVPDGAADGSLQLQVWSCADARAIK